MVGQSGGPTSVINASLAGVFKAARDLGAKHVYGMRNGVEGLLEGRCVDMLEHVKTDADIEILKRTPASYLGTCRFKLGDPAEKEADYAKIFAQLKKLDVKSYFYIGGNDSMDSINKMSGYAAANGVDMRFMGIPKTIDNDLVITDHTPGFGSASKYIASTFKELIRDAAAFNEKTVLVVEIMGRNAGWLTAASILAAGEDNEGPDMILLPETPLCEASFIKAVGEKLKEKNTLFIAVSEGVKCLDGEYLSSRGGASVTRDAFGHVALSGAGHNLKELIKRELGIKRIRSIEFSAIQRCAAHISSRTDVEEAFLAGQHGARCAADGMTSKMVVFKRLADEPYAMALDTAPVSEIANAEKVVPAEWIDAANYFVRKEFVTYALPLIQGELPPLMINGVPRHLVLKK